MSTTSIGLRVTREQWRTFKAAAEQEGLTASDWLRRLAQDRIDEQQREDRLAALDIKLSNTMAALKIMAGQIKDIHSKIDSLEATE
jgi:hypothetical protein